MGAVTVSDLRQLAVEFVAAEPFRLGTEGWWKPPLLATAPIDERFDQLPSIAADDHLHPRDLLSTARSVIVFFVPFKKTLVRENKDGDRPCRNWGLSYVQTNDLIGRLSVVLCDDLKVQRPRPETTRCWKAGRPVFSRRARNAESVSPPVRSML